MTCQVGLDRLCHSSDALIPHSGELRGRLSGSPREKRARVARALRNHSSDRVRVDLYAIHASRARRRGGCPATHPRGARSTCLRRRRCGNCALPAGLKGVGQMNPGWGLLPSGVATVSSCDCIYAAWRAGEGAWADLHGCGCGCGYDRLQARRQHAPAIYGGRPEQDGDTA